MFNVKPLFQALSRTIKHKVLLKNFSLGIDCLFSLNLIVIFFSPRNSVFFHAACINTSFVCKLET